MEDALAWYKTQYEVLEGELSEFQASSRELEAELEKDLDAADKRERSLRQKAEGLTYEVEEWKVCRSATGMPGCLPGLVNGPANPSPRGNTRSRNQRGTRPRAYSRKRSRRSAMLIGRFS